MIKATLKGLAAILMLLAVTVTAHSASFGGADAQRLVLATSGVIGVESIIQVQSGQLVPPSVAARNALRLAPGGKVLRIRLRKGARPVYVVKVKKGGQVHRIRVNARNGRVLGRQ